jgi:hypothetical protein
MVYGSGWVRLDDTTPLLDWPTSSSAPPRATANLSVDGIELPITVEFVQVNNAWVLNSDCMNDWMNETIKMAAKFWNTTEEGVIIARPPSAPARNCTGPSGTSPQVAQSRGTDAP